MRISNTAVTKLFGIFNHQIPLNLDDRITIVIGPNGLGKTAILRMVDGLINSQYSKLRHIPFQEFRLELADPTSTLRVFEGSRPEPLFDEAAAPKTPRELWLGYSRPGHSEERLKIFPRDHSDRQHIPLGLIDEEVPGLERISSRQWRYLPTWETLTLDDVLERFGDQIHPSVSRRHADPDWLKNLRAELHVRLVETQRLLGSPGPLALSENRSLRGMRDSSRSELTPAVTMYSHELALAIQTVLAESAELSQKLDSSFPRRVVVQDEPNLYTPADLRKELDHLESKRSYLVSTGLLDGTQNIGFGVSSQIDDEMMRVLSVYVKDTKQKLEVFDDIAMRIDLLTKMINDRFLFKSFEVSREKGFVFINPTGQEVPVTGLSSGEQHRLVLLYELLFKVQEGALILIDEPELSLHVVWQESFLRDIREIAKFRNFDILIATHSPQIINDRWDLAVELKGNGVVR